jgi:hypothetical protein
VDRPCDSLSLVPTLLTLLGRLPADRYPGRRPPSLQSRESSQLCLHEAGPPQEPLVEVETP